MCGQCEGDEYCELLRPRGSQRGLDDLQASS